MTAASVELTDTAAEAALDAALDERLDEALMETFPASDPVAITRPVRASSSSRTSPGGDQS